MMLLQEIHDTFAVAALPLVLMGAQLIKGIADSSTAGRMEGRADALAKDIPQQDPGVRGALDEIRQRRRYAEMGHGAMLGYKRRMAEEAGRNMGNNLVRAAGTSPGATQQALLRGQNVTQQSLMRAGAESEALAPQYMAMETPLVQDMADRKLALQQYARDQANLRATQKRLDANNAILGVFGLASAMLPKVGLTDKTPTDAAKSATAAASGAADVATGAVPGLKGVAAQTGQGMQGQWGLGEGNTFIGPDPRFKGFGLL